MIDTLNTLTVFQFILFAVATFLSFVQVGALAAHVVRGVGATLIPGIVATVLWIILFVVVR